MSKFPPTSQQLDRAARRGDLGVATSPITACGLWFWGVWVWWHAEEWTTTLSEMVRQNTTGHPTEDPAHWVGPLLGDVCTGLGMLWAIEWLVSAAQAPKYLIQQNRIEPHEGQGVRGWLIRATRALLWGSAGGLLLVWWIADLGPWVWGHSTGGQHGLPWDACITLTTTSLGLGVCVALVDTLWIRWLRWRALHMTREEMLADQRETEPNPQIKQQLRQLAQTPETSPDPTPLPAAPPAPDPHFLAAVYDFERVVIAISDLTNHHCVCLSYAPPLLNSPHRSHQSDTHTSTLSLLNELNLRQIPIIDEPPLLRQILAMTPPAHPIPEALYDGVILFLRMFPQKLPPEQPSAPTEINH